MSYRLCEAEFTRNLHVKLRCFLGYDMAKRKGICTKCKFLFAIEKTSPFFTRILYNLAQNLFLKIMLFDIKERIKMHNKSV